MPQLIQFHSIDKACEAFLNRDCKAWSVWAGKQFLFNYIGSTTEDAALQLQQLLESLDTSASSSAIYTLKVYEDLKKAEKITEKTPSNGSFNFRLKEYNQENTNWFSTFKEENKLLKQQVEDLRAELDSVPEESDEDDKTMIGKIGEMILNDPQKLPAIIAAFKNVMQMFVPEQPKLSALHESNTGNNPASYSIGSIDKQAGELPAIIETLKAKDERLQDHLQKLSDLADKDPEGFKYLLTMLDNIK